MNCRSPYYCRHGYTLVELLIVVTIMIILIAITLPTAKYAMEESKLRESSRTLNAYFASAKTRAAATGRPCGIAFQVDPIIGGSGSYQVTQMYLAEVAAPYGGSTTWSTARFEPDPLPPMTPTTTVLAFPTADMNADDAERAIVGTLIDPNEEFIVRFDYKGDWFRCKRIGTTPIKFEYQGSLSGNSSPPSTARPFQILRAPRRVGQPRELTKGTCIDLAFSGTSTSNTEFNVPATYASVPSVVVMFNAGGSLAGYYLGSSTPVTAGGTLHFLIGRVERVGDTGANSNLADPSALWVSIGRLTGSITSAENMPTLPYSGTDVANLPAARSAATNREQMGGR